MTMADQNMKYLGSKAASGAYQAIIAAMPAHDTYIETHLGSGAVMLRKPRAARSIGIDIDPETIAQLPELTGVEVENCDALEYLNEFDFESAGRTLIYADPPYLHSTRTSRKRYRFEYSDNDHRRLIATLRMVSCCGAMVMISGYPSRLYDHLLADWRTTEFQVMTRGGPRTEKLWMNFETGSVHWVTFAGNDYIDRQRIKRKAERWKNKYLDLPPGERLCVLSVLLGVEADPAQTITAMPAATDTNDCKGLHERK